MTRAVCYIMHGMRKTEWTAFATLMFTVIGTAVGVAWWTGARMATKEDLAVLRQEIRLEIQTLREHVDAQMAELRGYRIDHLNGHSVD